MKRALRICWPKIVELGRFYRPHGIVKREWGFDSKFRFLCFMFVMGFNTTFLKTTLHMSKLIKLYLLICIIIYLSIRPQ